MKITDSLANKKNDFFPLSQGVVTMYVCGPTVYGPTHMGHARTFVTYDLIRNYFINFKKWKVFFIMNITDVGHIVGDADEGDDKLQKQANLERVHPAEIADKYSVEYWRAYDSLLCDRPNIAPRATGHIIEMIDAVILLIKKGFAYEVDGDVYFDVTKASNYGKLSGQKQEGIEAGARIDVDFKKRNSSDFALWKKAQPNHIMQWRSPWGMGYPGWHIECSVMASKYLGKTIDVHGGAVELKFPHHENEIAISEALNDKEFVRFWVHTGMLMRDGQKMGKSLAIF
jgi:cysteinyl-tRNA synthetase